MKSSFIKRALSLTTLAAVLASCSNNTDLLSGNSDVPDGYFRATFFPGQGEGNTRAAINGESDRIQSLKCIIYQKQTDGTYKYATEKDVISYNGTAGTINPQTYTWPLTVPVTFELQKGDYKAVFVGNADKKLFSNQEKDILESYEKDYSSARINMPDAGPLGFNGNNMFYMSNVDFSNTNPSPNVILQRLVAKNVYGREFIDDNKAVSMLVDNIVKEIRNNQLTTDVVKGILKNKLTDALTKVTGLQAIAGGVTAVVDRLVNVLLGQVLDRLNDLLLQEVLTQVENALKGSNGGLLQLDKILNPWTTVKAVDVTYGSMAKSIDFDRTCRLYETDKTFKNIAISHEATDTISTFTMYNICGDSKISEINVNNENSDYDVLKQLLSSALGKVDEQVLNGLLINIHAPLGYTQKSNLEYRTTYKLINLTLNDFKQDTSGGKIGIEIKINDIVGEGLEELVKSILGDNIVSQLVGNLTDKLLQPIVKALDNLVILPLEIYLPNLGLSNIVVEGGWDATYVSDGTIAAQDAK